MSGERLIRTTAARRWSSWRWKRMAREVTGPTTARAGAASPEFVGRYGNSQLRTITTSGEAPGFRQQPVKRS
jgi:hypothetical protein